MTMRQMVATLSLQLMKGGGSFILFLSFLNLAIDDALQATLKGSLLLQLVGLHRSHLKRFMIINISLVLC